MSGNVSLPGGTSAEVTVNPAAVTALNTLIYNITHNTTNPIIGQQVVNGIPNGPSDQGEAHVFSVGEDGSSSSGDNKVLTAGTRVQGLVDFGTGSDTLNGSAATRFFIAGNGGLNGSPTTLGTAGYEFNLHDSAIVVGDNGNDSVIEYFKGGNVSAYLGSGDNSIAIAGDVLNLIGVDGLDTVSADQGGNIIRADGAIKVVVAGDASGAANNVLNLADNSTIDGGGTANTTYIKGDDQTITANTGSNNTYYLNGSTGDSVSIGGGSGFFFAQRAGAAFNVTGGSWNITADGSDTINLSGGSLTVEATGGAGILSIDETGGSLQVDLEGGANVSVTGGAGSVSGGAAGPATYYGAGNDTITLGGQNTTIVESGSATVSGGTGRLTFYSGGGTDLVTAGSGWSSLVGGSGTEYFAATSGTTYFNAGIGGADTFVAGTGTNIFNGAGAASNVFDFESSAVGGHYTISNYTEGRDTIHLGSGIGEFQTYNPSSGNTIVTLNDGTKITLLGYNGKIDFS